MALEMALWMVSSSKVSDVVDLVVGVWVAFFGRGGNASPVGTYEIFSGGRCFQALLLVVLIVLASYDALATETASAKTDEYLAALILLLYFIGRIVGAYGNLCS